MRRNTIVDVGGEDLFIPGRVVRCVDESHVVVIDVWKHERTYHVSEIKEIDYKGTYGFRHEPYNEYGNPVRFYRMPSLRKLKQMRSWFDKTVWKKNR
jgi:hypothetical protein